MPTDPKAVNQWASVIVPSFLAGVVGYATYIFVKLLCIDYLLNGANPRHGVAIALLTIYFVLFLFVVITYGRLLYIITVDPGYLPLGPAAKKEKRKRPQSRNSEHSKKEHADETLGQPYTNSSDTSTSRDDNADSPGLELFYTKRVFVCSQDGRPKWCSECATWKPDRTHHCSDIGRCVYKMDHYCPWVGGVVGERSFKFFIQFVVYACLFWIYLLVVSAIYVAEQIQSGSHWERQLIALVAVASMFGLFAGGMAGSSLQFALYNLTTIENLAYKRRPWTLAVLIPPSFEVPKEGYPTTVTYPLPLPEDQERTTASHAATGNAASARDAQAKRTFAVMSLGIGRNPWDLGYVQNFKSVMGNNIWEWFLPITRSPLCNHESDESWFEYGRWVEQLLVDNGFMSSRDMIKPKPVSKPFEETHPMKKGTLEMSNALVGMTAEGIPRHSR